MRIGRIFSSRPMPNAFSITHSESILRSIVLWNFGEGIAGALEGGFVRTNARCSQLEPETELQREVRRGGFLGGVMSNEEKF